MHGSRPVFECGFEHTMSIPNPLHYSFLDQFFSQIRTARPGAQHSQPVGFPGSSEFSTSHSINYPKEEREISKQG